MRNVKHTMGAHDRNGRLIRPWVWARREDWMCDCSLDFPVVRTGRTWCSRRATVSILGGQAMICDYHAGRVRRGLYAMVPGFRVITPEAIDDHHDGADVP